MNSQKNNFAVLRIVFGLIWAIDAYFKWQPQFFGGFVDYLTEGAAGQPLLVKDWINFWINLAGINPHFFAFVIAIAETAIAFGLIFGFLTRIAIYGGIAMSLVIWSTAEGFGGPYAAGSTDIGTAIIYVLVFVLLFIGKSWENISIDGQLKRKFRHI